MYILLLKFLQDLFFFFFFLSISLGYGTCLLKNKHNFVFLFLKKVLDYLFLIFMYRKHEGKVTHFYPFLDLLPTIGEQ